jgi:predicted phosphodiesterase
MRLGLITDVHESVELLRAALENFRAASVDQVVVLGDVFETGERIEETCEVLLEAKAIGVWGNHDFGMCCNPPQSFRDKYGDMVVDFMSSLRPRLEIEGCHFTHTEPWLDPEELLDLWYFDGLPDEPAKVARIFESTSHRIMFAGHLHLWLLATPDGMLEWKGKPQRYYSVLGALCYGNYAVFDTETCELVPGKMGT